MWRKWLISVLIIVVAISLAACSAQQSSQKVNQQPATGQPATTEAGKGQGTVAKDDKNIKVGIVVNGQGNFFNAGIFQETQRLVKEKGGTPVALDSLGQREKMLSDIETLIQQNVDALIVLLGDPTFLEPALKKAKEKNIPWISVAAGFHPLVDLEIDSNDWAMGAKVAAYMAARLGGKGKIVEIYGDLILPTRARAEALRAVLKEYPEIQIVERHAYAWPGFLEDCRKWMETVLQKYPKPGDIQAVFAAFDGAGIGAAQAIEAAGRKEIFVVGIDGDPLAYENMRNKGVFAATAAHDLKGMAEKAVEWAFRMAKGEKPPVKMMFIDSPLITQENVPPATK
ncbi:ribose transport system substrate-binding protein [Thermanaeromonas toyohensis ToBE]|uniref:Ribose transport system substrate-binding protein n=1 Tax=Thermanaeromonas toyohensis ToBE TaxID=698762 RepID=A0A1W1VPI8_9FIRM|nr:substrate-binding domain-containing protein [Thermanaeromonas toyohensis]SMB95193.1 ribose transport system substrate-binding protein [Thermanaeromonas toyohensis ToBE]